MTALQNPQSLDPKGESPWRPPLMQEGDTRATFAESWRLVARHRLVMLAVPLLVAIAAIVYGVSRPRQYTSAASFMGASGDLSRSGLLGLAAQYGFRMPSADVSQSPQFYADLLRSRQVLDSVVNGRYRYRAENGETREGTLADAFEAAGPTPGLRNENAMVALDRRTHIAVGRETGVVRLSVSTQWPELSSAIAKRYLDLLNHFNVATRQSRATAERRFTEARLREAERDLRASEDRLKEFRRLNRQYQGAPTLEAENERLQRDVSIRQQVYSTLLQAYEQARIDEVRDTPVITVVEQPYVPVRPDRRGLLRLAILGALVGAIGAAGYVVLRERLSSRGLLRTRKQSA
jgi:uncharacterized protein involved in exopolysaccharide biosynthesis